MSDITPTELEVLKVLWQQSPAEANEIIARLNEQKVWHEKTVKTLLGRLVKKQAIGFEKQQRKYFYYPLIEQETYQINESESLVQRIFSGRLSPLVAGFAKSNKLNKDDINELKKLISQWEKEND